jgi:hypothetical protein
MLKKKIIFIILSNKILIKVKIKYKIFYIKIHIKKSFDIFNIWIAFWHFYII